MIARSALYAGTAGFTLSVYAWLLAGADALILIPFAVLAIAGSIGVCFQKG